MLSKVSDTTINITPVTTEVDNFSENRSTHRNRGRILFYENNINYIGNYTLSVSTDQTYYYLKIIVNDTVILEDTNVQQGNRTISIGEQNNLFNIKIYLKSEYPEIRNYTLNGTFTCTRNKLYKKGKKELLFIIKNIGGKVKGILLGMLPDGTRWDGN